MLAKVVCINFINKVGKILPYFTISIWQKILGQIIPKTNWRNLTHIRETNFISKERDLALTKLRAYLTTSPINTGKTGLHIFVKLYSKRLIRRNLAHIKQLHSLTLAKPWPIFVKFSYKQSGETSPTFDSFTH